MSFMSLGQIWIFVFSYLIYAAVYIIRITWSYNKKSFSNEIHLSDSEIGTVDMCFLLSLALSSIFLGN